MTFYIAAITRETAEQRAIAISRGYIPFMPIYTSKAAAEKWCAYLNETHRDNRIVHGISIGAKQERIAA